MGCSKIKTQYHTKSMEGFQSLVTQVKAVFSGPDQAVAQLQQLPIRAEVYVRLPFGLEVR